MSVRENRHVYLCIIEGWRGVPEIIAGVLKRIRDDIDKFVDNKTKDYENI